MLSVSVAMATYNGQLHIKQQLESLAEQTHLPAELVVTDDASNDDTLSILTSFAESSPFPVHIHPNESRLGYRANFMRAAGLCKAELIAFCDQDDRWYSKKIATCVSRFTEPEMLLVYHDADVVTEGGRQISLLNNFAARKPISLPLSLKPLAHALGFTQIFRRSLLELSNFWEMSIDQQFDNERMAHDQWFFFLASTLGTIGYLNEPLAAYIQHGKNTFGRGAEIGPLQKLQLKLRNPTDQLSRRAAAAENRARILEEAESTLRPVERERAETAAKKYRRLSDLNIIRKRIYASAAFGDRLGAWLEILKTQGYGGTWNLAGTSLIKDLCIGVPIGPLAGVSFKQ